jgi:hypothetical protein
MDRNDPSYKGQRGYNRFLLAIYDPWVIGFMTRAVWKVPVPPAVERYRRLMGRRHLDVGPGTGYFLAKAAPPDGTDGNPATVADPTWTPLFSSPAPLTTPAFPDHPSGHGCVSGAVVETLKDFFGTDSVSFSVTSSLSGHDASVRPVLTRDQGDRRCASVGRDPLPDRRHAGARDRPEGRALAGEAVLRSGDVSS